MEALEKLFDIMRYGPEGYHLLMQQKVNRILMVSSVYDAFTFEKDGKLSDRLYGEYRKLDLSSNPEFVNVSTADQALDAIAREKFDLVITLLRIGEMSVFDFSAKIKHIDPSLNIVLLLNIPSDISIVERNRNQMSSIDEVYLWNGDINLFLAIIKQVEDRLNFEFDLGKCDIPLILLVEDSIAYYSKFLPILYTEIMLQTQKLIKSELDDLQKRYHMKARAKVLMVHNFEDAVYYLDKYSRQLSLVISDVRYPKSGELCKDAGLHLIRKVKGYGNDIPCILQSSEEHNRNLATEMSVSFLNKYSDTLLKDLRFVLVEFLGYGMFVFKDSSGRECKRASTISDFINILNNVDNECVRYHAERNHFSRWFTAHGFLRMAEQLRKKRLTDFSCMEEVKLYLKDVYYDIYRSKFQGKVIQYDAKNIGKTNQVMILSEGSFGGKGRGITFLNALTAAVSNESIVNDFEVIIPSTFIIGTDEMVEFFHLNGYPDFESEEEREKYFLNGELTDKLNNRLFSIVERTTKPLIVRSSGLLEDTLSIPVAGLYESIFISNSCLDVNARFDELKTAVKKVYLSLYRSEVQNFLRSVNYLMQNEKMAVIIQEVAGSKKCDYYFPDVSGLLRSSFFEQTSIPSVSLCLGLGTALEEHQTFYSCVADSGRPESCRIIHASSKNSVQKKISVINLKKQSIENHELSCFMKKFDSDDSCNDVEKIYDQISLKYDKLINTLTLYLGLIENFLQTSVEIEFSLEFSGKSGGRDKVFLLQIKPFSKIQYDLNEFDLKNYGNEPDLLITNCFGHGIIDNIKTIIVQTSVPQSEVESEKLIKEIADFNREMKNISTEYILIGKGTWGGRTYNNNIPVNALDLSHARVFINILDHIDDGFYFTHFFYNLNVMDTVYMQTVVNPQRDIINLTRLREKSSSRKSEFFEVLVVSGETKIIMNGRNNTFKLYSEFN